MCSAVGNFVKGAAKFIADAAVNVWHAAERLPGDFAYLATHLNDLKAWSKFLGDLGTVAGAVALVAAVHRLPADALGFESRRGRLVDGRRGRRPAATYADRSAKTGADTGLAVEGKGSWRRGRLRRRVARRRQGQDPRAQGRQGHGQGPGGPGRGAGDRTPPVASPG